MRQWPGMVDGGYYIGLYRDYKGLYGDYGGLYRDYRGLFGDYIGLYRGYSGTMEKENGNYC